MSLIFLLFICFGVALLMSIPKTVILQFIYMFIIKEQEEKKEHSD